MRIRFRVMHRGDIHRGRRTLPELTATALRQGQCVIHHLRNTIAAIGAAALSCAAFAAVPIPTVTGPIGSDAPGSPDHNYTFLLSDVDLAGRGYVEEEFFISGTANVYDTPNPGGGIGNSPVSYPTGNVVTAGHPYKSRIVVRRPSDPSKFNGIVVIEWANVTASYDAENMWFKTHDYLTRHGYAHVRVSAQSAGIANATTGLKAWSPARYGTLDVTDSGAVTGDALGWDVYSQAAQAVRSVPAVMGGMPVQMVLGIGESQSAGHLAAYLNSIHPIAHVLDGAYLHIGGQIIRSDLDIPVFKLLSESEFDNYSSDYEIPELQPDTAKFHLWQVAGTSHGDWHNSLMRSNVILRDLGLPFNDSCTYPTRSRMPMTYVMDSVIDHLVTWVKTGTAPPPGVAIQLTSDAIPVAARDKYGNAIGGIRVPEFAVPVALDNGTNAGPGLCYLDGTHVPFDDATLAALYPYRGAYPSMIAAAAKQDIRAGFILAEDAQISFANANASIVGTGLTCGPLCKNIGQFAQNPSTSILRDHTANYDYIGGAALVATLDQATTAVATGYTYGTDPLAHQSFAAAVVLLQTYIQQVQQLQSQGRIPDFTAGVFVNEANVLIGKLSTM